MNIGFIFFLSSIFLLSVLLVDKIDDSELLNKIKHSRGIALDDSVYTCGKIFDIGNLLEKGSEK